MSATPTKPTLEKKSSTPGSSRRLSLGFGKSPSSKNVKETPKDEEAERRKSISDVTAAREAEQERLVVEAEIAQQRAKLEREESRRIVASQAEEERRRRLEDAKAVEAAEEAERMRNRKSVNEEMENERQRRLSEMPDSPAAVQALQEKRRSSQSFAVQAMEEERKRRLGVDAESEQTTMLQRRKSQSMVTAQVEAERQRRIKTPLKSGSRPKGATPPAGIGSSLIVLLSTVAILVLIALTLEEKAEQYGWYDTLASVRSTVGEYVPILAPPPPPPPEPRFFGLF